MKCQLCKEAEGYITWNFNGKIRLGPHHTILVCPQCDLSIQEQGFLILEELKVPEPHILKKGMILDENIVKPGIYLKLVDLGGKHVRKKL